MTKAKDDDKLTKKELQDVAKILELILKGTNKYPRFITIEAMCIYLGGLIAVTENMENKETANRFFKIVSGSIRDHWATLKGLERATNEINKLTEGGNNDKKNKRQKKSK